MSLTTGRGPFSADPAGRFSAPIPAGVAYVEPFGRRIRGMRDGRAVVDSDDALLVHRAGRPPQCAFPSGDLHGIDGEPVPEAPGHVHVAWDAAEAWYEEDQPMVYARNPYHRVDCVRTSRRLRVQVGDTVLADTTRTLAVFETSLARRLYVARDEVRMDLLEPSDTTTYCAYKGTATYWHAVVGGVRVEDAAWVYEDPLPESLPLAGLLCFEDTRVDVVVG